MNYREAWANGEIEAGTLVDAIEDQAREIERLNSDYNEACEDAMCVARELERQKMNCLNLLQQLEDLKAQPGRVVPEWLTSSRTFADRLYAAGWRDHADAQHAGVAGMYDELLAATPSAGSQEQGE